MKSENMLIEELKKQEKKETLYRNLIDGKTNIIKKRLHPPQMETVEDYGKKLCPYCDFWDSINNDETNGIKIISANRKFEGIGINYVPVAYVIENAKAVFQYLKKTDKMNVFIQNYNKITEQFPELADWCFKNREKISDPSNKNLANQVIELAKYFKKGAQKDCFITQWQIPLVDTKFHHKYFEIFRNVANIILGLSLSNKAEFYQYFHLFERKKELSIGILAPNKTINGFKKLSISAEELAEWKENHIIKTVVIFENNDNGEYFMKFAKPTKPCIVIFGAGKAILDLKKVPWIKTCEIFYSGDKDKDGYSILSEMREIFPTIKSVGMDSLGKANPVADNKRKPMNVKNLTEEEKSCYDFLEKHGLRIEEERDIEKILQTIQEAI